MSGIVDLAHELEVENIGKGEKLAKYVVLLNTTASAAVEVEAEDVEEAIEKAFENAPYSCHQCPDIGDWDLASDLYSFIPESEAVYKIEE